LQSKKKLALKEDISQRIRPVTYFSIMRAKCCEVPNCIIYAEGFSHEFSGKSAPKYNAGTLGRFDDVFNKPVVRWKHGIILIHIDAFNSET
jgi:hypothetical protein